MKKKEKPSKAVVKISIKGREDIIIERIVKLIELRKSLKEKDKTLKLLDLQFSMVV